MKKILLAVFALVYMTVLAVDTAQAQAQLNVAIQNSVGELAAIFERDTGVAVLAIHSDSAQMSDHIINEIIVAFMGIQHARGITVVNRMQLNTFAAQLDFNTAGLIDDTAAQSLGTLMNVRYVVTGTFELREDFSRFSVQIMDMETMAIRSTYTDIQIDGLIASLLGIEYSPAQVVEVRSPRREPREPRYPPRANWLSAEITAVGLGVRYERHINDVFTVGGTIFLSSTNYDTLTTTAYEWSEIIGGLATVRLFPGGFPFYLEAGFGFGLVGYDVLHEDGDGGVLLSLAAGVRLGGRTRGFFVNPFVSIIPLVLTPVDHVHIRAGIGLGWAW